MMSSLRITTIALLFCLLFSLPATAVTAQTGTRVTFPSPEVEFIIGPQLKSGDPANPSAWFDANAIESGVRFGERFPVSPPMRQLPGTLSLTNGSRVVRGTGTTFLSSLPAPVNQFNFYIKDESGALQNYYLTSIENDLSLTISQSWQQPTQSGRPYFIATGPEANDYLNLNYYDQGLVQYDNCYRTGDQKFCGYARKIVDSWWRMPHIDEGRASVENILAPRHASLEGLMLRAMDGRPEMWPWIVKYTRRMFEIWVSDQTGNTTTDRATYPSLYFGAREGGYMLLYAATLGKVHPDPAIRQEFTAKALHGAINYYVRLQKSDGSWRWGDDAWIGEAMQPFHVGILLEGMIAVHRLTGDARVRDSIVKGAEALYSFGFNPNQWDAMYYQVWGSWRDGTDCSRGCGEAANAYPPEFGKVAEARQLNANCLHAFGYAYLLTGDQKFKTWGDEILDASFNAEQGFRLLAWFREKEYDEAYRSGGKYLAWRLGSAAPTPSPSPVPSPTPKPSPTPAVYEWFRFNFSTDGQLQELVKSLGTQGYGNCFVGPSGKALYCARLK